MPNNALQPSAILYWHPKFRVYTLENNDILLLQSGSSTLFKNCDYPLLKYIDGTKTLEDLLRDLNLTKAPRKLLTLLDSLISKGYITNIRDSTIPNYLSPLYSIFESNKFRTHLAQRNENNIINLSSASEKHIRQWEAIIKGSPLAAKHKPNINQVQGLTVVIVDDFLDASVVEALGHSTHYMVIKPGSEDYWLGPVSTPQNPLAWTSFRTRLLQNQPTLGFLKQLVGDERLTYPIQHIEKEDDCNLPKLIECLNKHIGSCLNNNKHELCIVQRNDFSTQHHPVVLSNRQDRNHTTQNEIKLSEQEVLFDADGGARSMHPEATVEKLLPFVSPITGRITHLDELNTKISSQIKIYTSGFFKQPRHDENLSNQSFVQLCMGKGATPIQSKASALSEAIERLAAFYEDYDRSTLATPEALAKRYYLYQDIAPFSHSQYSEFETKPEKYSIKQSAKAYRSQKIRWADTWSLTHNELVNVPLSLCYQHTPAKDYKFGNWTSNGCAAGNNTEEAILQAMFELIERDATAIWWYNKVKCPAYSINNLSEDFIKQIKLALSQEQDFWLLDATTDLEIPVIVAVAKNKKTGGFSLGFGCHLSAPLAAQRALTELCQLIPIRSQKNSQFNFDDIQNEAFLYADNALEATLYSQPRFTDIKAMITHLTQKLANAGIETLALDYSRPDLPLKTVKVFTPGLCHIWPQFANERLYTVPVKLSWFDKPKTETELNPIKLYI